MVAFESPYEAVIDSPIGKLGLKTEQDHLIKIDFVTEKDKLFSPTTSLAKEATRQLDAYFKGKLSRFDLPLLTRGTAFQEKVWSQLQNVSFGETLTYSDLSERIKTGPRAVGNACRHNPIVIIIPCHRVIARHHLGGYSGARSGNFLAIKTWLLRHEQG